MNNIEMLGVIKKIIGELRQYSVPGDNWSFSTHKDENYAAYMTMWDRLDSALEKFEDMLAGD